MQSAMFDTLADAMRFMARGTGSGAARPAMAKAAADRLYGGDEVSLAGEDGAAQRAMLSQALGRLDNLQYHVLMARHRPRLAQCHACGHPCVSPEWWSHVEAISNAALQLEVVKSHTMKRGARDGAVARYFGQKVTLLQLAEECDISVRTMNDVNSRIHKWLGGSRVEKSGGPGVVGVEQRTLAAAEAMLETAGHIRRTVHR